MNILEQLAKNLAKQGAPVLGGMIGTAIGGPAGTVAGSLAGKAIEALAEGLGTDATPEAVNGAVLAPGSTAAVQATEAQAGELIKVWEIEAQRASDAQKAEIEQGFTAWQAIRILIQFIVWGGWAVLLPVGLFGGNWGVKPLVGFGEMLTAWGTVTTVWMIVFHGGHTIKEVLPALRFGKAR
jgi:hypothetical protein